jgi:phosphatidate cytidylyltransferase
VSHGQITGTIPFSWVHAAILSVLFPVVGTLGDLVESLFKRAVDVKDSNAMVYGLGGILDMIDSILFAAPMLYISIEFFLK